MGLAFKDLILLLIIFMLSLDSCFYVFLLDPNTTLVNSPGEYVTLSRRLSFLSDGLFLSNCQDAETRETSKATRNKLN